MQANAMSLFTIGPFRLDPQSKVVTHNGAPVPLGARAVAVLSALVAKANELVPKSAIIEEAWPGLVVEDGNLAVQISAIRKVLAQAPGGDRWVETLARRGYRFVGPVVALPRVALPLAAHAGLLDSTARLTRYGDVMAWRAYARTISVDALQIFGSRRLVF